MTNSHPLARLLDGVTRYDLSDHGDAMLQKPLGDWVWYDDVLAALEAATPPDLVEAVERLLPVARHYGGLTDDHVAAIQFAEATIRNFRKVSVVSERLTADAPVPDLVEARQVVERLENADPFQFPFSAADAELDAANTLRALIALEGEKPDKWQCPINYPGCKKNCGGYGCGN